MISSLMYANLCASSELLYQDGYNVDVSIKFFVPFNLPVTFLEDADQINKFLIIGSIDLSGFSSTAIHVKQT